VTATLSKAATLWGERPITVARELTKVHQEFIRGASAASVIGRMTNIKGEFTIVVGPAPPSKPALSPATDHEIVTEFGRTTEIGGVSRRQAISIVARRHGRSSNDVYTLVEIAKKSG
jgi:16S rRNA (cytidine1402-2'-O)-methyltransferase